MTLHVKAVSLVEGGTPFVLEKEGVNGAVILNLPHKSSEGIVKNEWKV